MSFPTEQTRIAPLTVDQVHAMLRAGILHEGAPIELIEGQLVYKDRSGEGKDPMTVGELHNLVVKLSSELDPELRPKGCHFQARGPLSIPPHNEPEPDGTVLRGRRETTRRACPRLATPRPSSRWRIRPCATIARSSSRSTLAGPSPNT